MCSYSVVVERVDESLQGAALRPFTWRSLAALSRTTANVSKVNPYLYLSHVSKQLFGSMLGLHMAMFMFHVQELMISYVVVPSNMTEEDISSPECLRRLKVQVRRLPRFGFNYQYIILAMFNCVWACSFRKLL